MNESIQLEMNPSVKKQNAIATSIALFSQDVANYSFDITFADLELQTDDEVEVLAKLPGGNLEYNTSTNLVEVGGKLIARYVFDTKLVDSEGHVFCYVYLKRGDKSADVGAFYFEVDLSELDKVGGKIAEVYDGRYEDLVAGFEIRLQEYRDSLPQASEVRAEVDVVLSQFGVDSQAKLNQYDTDAQQVITDNQTAFGLAETGRQNTYEQAEAVRNQSSNQAVTDWEQGADAIIEIVEDNESARVVAEETRKTSEIDRVSSETTRKTNETTRINNEDARKSAESVRVANEEERELNEAERISKDSERDSKIEVVEEGLEQHKLDYVEDTKRVRATEPPGKLLAYDTFNRPDGSLGVSDSGHQWISYGTPAVISSGFHKGESTNNTLYDVSAIVLDDKVRSSVLKVEVVKDGSARGVGLFLGVDQENGINLFSTHSNLSLAKIVEGVRTDLYQSLTYPPWEGVSDSDWYMKERVLQTLELTTVYVDSVVLFNIKLILNGVEFSEKMKITDPETLGIISNANKVGITQTHRFWYAKNFVVRGLRA